MADAPPKGKGGSGLGKKMGPLPLWAWMVGGLVVGYVLYKFASGQSGSSGTAQQTQTTAAATPSDSTGLVPSAGSTGDTGQTTSDLVSALGGQQANLLQALEAQSSDALSLAQSQITAAQQNPQISPSSTSETQPMVGTQPGGSQAPVYVYVSPSATATPASAKPAATTTTTAKQTSPALRYYTYKRDVPLGPGQTVHFTAGRGYYAA